MDRTAKDRLDALIRAQLKIQYPNEPTAFERAYQRAQVKSEGNDGLWWQLTHVWKGPMPLREVRLVEGREFKVDFVWFQPKKLVLEIEGGIWTNGRHVRPKGYKSDMEKYNAIQKLGFPVHRFPPEAVPEGLVLKFLEEFFSA